MAEILIRVNVRDLPQLPKWQRVGRTTRGDCVAIQPDGWGWSQHELTAPYWRILTMPLTPVEIQAFIQKETDPGNNKTLTNKREIYLDLDSKAWSKSAADYLADDTRAVPMFDASGEKNRVLQQAVITRLPADQRT